METRGHFGPFFFMAVFLIASTASAYQKIEFVREIGNSGNKAKERQLSSPRAMALSEKKIYIADTNQIGHRRSGKGRPHGCYQETCRVHETVSR